MLVFHNTILPPSLSRIAGLRSSLRARRETKVWQASPKERKLIFKFFRLISLPEIKPLRTSVSLSAAGGDWFFSAEGC